MHGDRHEPFVFDATDLDIVRALETFTQTQLASLAARQARHCRALREMRLAWSHCSEQANAPALTNRRGRIVRALESFTQTQLASLASLAARQACQPFAFHERERSFALRSASLEPG